MPIRFENKENYCITVRIRLLHFTRMFQGLYNRLDEECRKAPRAQKVRKVMRMKANMTVEEMRTLKDMLMKRMENFTDHKEQRIQKLLADPTDRNIGNQLCLIHEDEKHIDECWNVIRELKFDIEDITGEPEP